MGTSSAWTLERREQQRKTIQHTRPWEKSTGPRTREGKAVASRNAKRSLEQIYPELCNLEDELARLDVARVYGNQELRPESDKAYRIVEKRVVHLENELQKRLVAAGPQSKIYQDFMKVKEQDEAAWLF